jgi:uncharacterized membrane protein
VFLALAANVALLLVIGRWLALSVPASLALMAWPPVWYLLVIGQLELLILALAMLAWRVAAAGRDGRAGLWLGIAAAIKLYPLLFLLPFVPSSVALFSRDWRSTYATAGVVSAST